MSYFSIAGLTLSGNVLTTVNVENTANCVIDCLRHPTCQSVNFHVSANPLHACELNSKTEDDVTLTGNSDVIHYSPIKSQGVCSLYVVSYYITSLSR